MKYENKQTYWGLELFKALHSEWTNNLSKNSSFFIPLENDLLFIGLAEFHKLVENVQPISRRLSLVNPDCRTAFKINPFGLGFMALIVSPMRINAILYFSANNSFSFG